MPQTPSEDQGAWQGDRRRTPSLEMEFAHAPLRIKGTVAFLCAIIVLLLIGMGKLVFFTMSEWGEPVNIGKFFDQHARVEAERHAMTKDGIESLIYIMALSQKERENLASRMKMPEFLRRQLKESER